MIEIEIIKPKVDKEAFIILAKAYVKQRNLEDNLYNSIRNINRDHDAETDFVGLPFYSDILANEVMEVLGTEFSYWYYDCDQDWEKYNNNVTYDNDKHPECYNFGDLYDFAIQDIL